MSRNVNEILHCIKKNLVDDTSIPDADIYKKWNIDEPTFEILAQKITIIDSYIVDNEHRVVLLTVYNNDDRINYLVTYGYSDSLKYSCLEEVGFEFAHFLIIVKEQNIPCNRKVATDSFLTEFLFTGEDLSIEQVQEYLPKCYGPVCSYLVNEQLPNSDIERQQFVIKVLYDHELRTSQLSVLNFYDDTIKAYGKVLNNTCRHIPFEDVFLSILEKKYKFCYLDLFRCIERLFKISMTHEFEKTLQSTIEKTKIAEFVKQYAGNGHQLNQIQYLFTLLPTDITDIVKNAFTGDNNVGNIFYETRNNIVHYQISVCSYEGYTDVQWNALIQFCLLSIDALYSEFDNYLNEIPDI